MRKCSLDLICSVGIVILYLLSTPGTLMKVMAWYDMAWHGIEGQGEVRLDIA